MSQQNFPPGWDEERARQVLAHYENQTEDEEFAEIEAALILTLDSHGDKFILEDADAFEREVAELRGSEKFTAFLAERSKEPGQTSLEEIEQRLAHTESPPDD